MNLCKGQLFHNRYLLVSDLGHGASAEVWKARDTKANNLIVALKIFSQHSEMDSYGLQNFEREFTTVYNMKHSNLLPPTGYDICEGRPYLIMQYCENGSCGSMVGRMEEEDIIKFLHDVSAGLEYLHDHNIIHQDIKPDNVLLDDNCNFLVTDFGISVSSAGCIHDSNGMSGGTRAYMGPERFEGITTTASDIWSLGATAVELLIGNPPYGEHGGLLQADDEPLPELPNLQPEVKGLIMGCLIADPTKRLKANEIRQKIDLYWETGSWTQRSSKQTVAIAVTAVLCVLMCVGIFLWDYNRTKVYYYKDYGEYWGVPKGIGRMMPAQMKHREQTYRFEYRRFKLRHLSLVNSAGKVVGHTDTETMNSRFSDVYYFYTDKGKIDYMTVYDPYGNMLFKLDYDENLRTATFRLNDEYGTEMNLRSNTNELYKTESAMDERSRISRYLLTYNDDGLLVERRYAGFQNIPASDEDKIYGQRYRYDGKGRKIEETFIGMNGEITANKNGLSIRKYTYNDDNDWTSVTYLNAEGKGSHDGNNCSVVKLEYDRYGNRIREMYYTLDGAPAIRTDMSVAGFSYMHDDNGCRTRTTCLGVDGQPAYCNAGIVSYQDEFNADGFIIRQSFLDENGNLVLYNDGNAFYAYYTLVPNKVGLPLEIAYYDENGDPVTFSGNVFRITHQYNEAGKETKREFYDPDGALSPYDGYYCGMSYEYDEFNQTTRVCFLNSEGNLTTFDGVVADYRLEYNRQGAVTKVSRFDAEGNLVTGTDLYAGFIKEYDESGNLKTFQYFDTEGSPCMSDEHYSRIEYVYDPNTNYLTTSNYYDTKDKLVWDWHYKYDGNGNIIQIYKLVGGKLEKGAVVLNHEYDENNRELAEWCTDLSGKPVNFPDKSYSKEKYEYDERGNICITTYWATDGKAAVDNLKAHRRVREFDEMNRVVRELNLDVNDKPLSGKGVYPESRVKYDQWGNQIEVSCYDGYGNPMTGADGYFILKKEYDRRRNIIHEEFLDTKGNPVVYEDDYASADYTYDNHGNSIEERYYDTSKCIRIEKYQYNDKQNMTEWLICDGKGNQTDDYYNFSRVTVEYDDRGVVPHMRRFYVKGGSLIATQSYNQTSAEWNEIKLTGHGGSTGGGSSYSSSWQEYVRSDAQACPQKLGDGIYAQKITYSNSSVTVVLKLTEISKYDIGNIDSDALKEIGDEFKSTFRDAWSLPSNVSLTLIFQDKADRTLFTL